MNFILIQFIGGIAFLFLILSYFQKKKNYILLMEIIAYVMFSVHYFLLDGVSGAICNLVGLVALLVIYLFEKYHLNYKKIIVAFLILILIIINLVMYQNIFSIFPMIALSIAIVSFLFDDENLIRVVGFVSAFCWLVYAFVYHSYVAVFFEIIIMISTCVSFFQSRRLKK